MLKYLIPAILFTSSALAADPSAINFSAKLNDINGPALDCDTIAPDGKCAKLIPLTLGRLCAEALSQPAKNALVVDSIRRGALATRVYAEGTFPLTTEEVQLIEKALPDLSVRPAVILDALRLLDPTLVANTIK